jgi:hypothetical protein
MSDELARWAARRAPELRARAEAEVIAELRRALLAEALGPARPVESEAPPPQPPPPPPAAVQGEVLWAYGVTGASDSPIGLRSRLGEEHAVEHLEHDGLALLVSRVARAEFAEEPLRRNLNDFEWLERAARAHEEVLEQALEHAPVVPLRLCTIFEGETGAARMLETHEEALRTVLETLEGRQEWSVKLLVDPPLLLAAGARRRGAPADVGPEGSGAEYLLRRRAEREDREAADQIASEIADDVHARLQDWAAGAVLRPAQNRELSRHEGEMLLNGAYLVEAAKVPQLRELVAELRDRHAELGARIELSGPFPAYNFVPRLEP